MTIGQHHLRRLLWALPVALSLFSARGATAAPLLSRAEVMPAGEIRPGMKGYGLTVFKGTRIERFSIDVLSVMPKANMGKPLILVRLGGGPITQRGAFGIQGMSGSPCYVNDRLIGAFAYAFSFPKEPIGMITPIEDMAEALDPRLPTQPAGMSGGFGDAPTGPVDLSEALSPGFGGGFPFTDPQPTAVMPLAIPVMVNGLNPGLLNRVASMLRPFNLAAVAGPGRMTTASPIPLAPGAAIGVSLLSGDIEMTGVGTVTYRKAKELLAFGHPMFQLGATSFPVTTAFVHDVFPGFQISFKMASPVRTVGTLVQDRPFSIAARLGTVPGMVPITCTVDDRCTGRTRTYQVQAANHPFLISRLLPIAANQAIFEVHSVPGDTTANVDLQIDTAELGTVRRRNVFFDARAVDVAAVEDLLGAMQILNDNSFRRITIKGVRMKVLLEPKRNTAVVDRIFIPQDRYEPGETVDVGVVMRPYRGEPFVTRTSIRIPENAAPGRASLVVSGGPAPPPGQVVVSGGATAQTGTASAAPSATNVQQLVRRFLERERNDQLVTRVLFPTTSVNVGGESLSMLPSTLADVMRTSKSTGLRMEREELKSVRDMPCVVGGAQALSITIERKDHSEKRTPSAVSTTVTPAATTETTSAASAPTSVTVGEEDEESQSVLGSPQREPLSHSEKPDAKPGKKGEKGSKTPDGKSGSAATGAGSTASGAAGSTPGAASSDAGVLGRKAIWWRQTSQSEFERGTLTGVAVTSAGELRQAASLRLLSETPEQYVWSVAAVGSDAFVGTGNSGLVYRVTSAGNPEVLYRTGELEVHALVKDAEGNLYAGTSPSGKVIRIRPNGQGDELLALNPGSRDALPVAPRVPAKFILSLALGADGTVYAGTGPDGLVYRIPRSGAPSILFRSSDRYIQSLVAAPDGTLYAGTAESGLIYAIHPDGSARVVLDSDQSAITALARDADGNLYAATGGQSGGSAKGTVIRISADGDVKTLWDKGKASVQALKLNDRGHLYAACGSAIYEIAPAGDVTVHSDTKRAQLMALDINSSGDVVAGSANVGTVYRLESSRTGTYESVVHDARVTARWGEIRWLARRTPGSEIKVETRSGNIPEPDDTWSAWAASVPGISGQSVASPPARYIQYRVTLAGGEADGSRPEGPSLQEMNIAYLPRNQAPTVSLQAPAGGEYWSKSQTIRWTGSDPDRDTLSYDLSYSIDGRVWNPIGRPLVIPPGTGSTPPPTAAAGADSGEAWRKRVEDQLAANPALARFREALAQDSDVSAEMRAEALKRADELIGKYDGSQGTAGAPASTESTPTPPRATGLRETTIAWDTSILPDGVYRVRVVATDRPSNPSGALTAEVVSEPIIVANRAPAVFVFRKSAQADPSGRVTIDGLADARAPLVGAQFRVDGKDWSACEAADGIWDSPFEAWTCSAGSLSRGEHTLEVKVVDAAGNTATKTATFTVRG